MRGYRRKPELKEFLISLGNKKTSNSSVITEIYTSSPPTKKKSDSKMYNFFLIFNLNDKVHSKNWLMTLRVGMNSFYWTSNITWQLHVVIQNMLSKKHKSWLHLSDGVITRKLSSTPLETMDPLQWGKVRSCVCHRYKSFDYRKLLS